MMLSMRSEVLKFAEAMEERLRANDHKGGWETESPTYLLARLREEVDELRVALAGKPHCHGGAANVLHEAADVANFAMMLADVWRLRKNRRSP